MSIKPVLVPDQDAKTLRALLENFDAAATGRAPKQLNEMDYGGGRSPHGGHGLPRDDDDADAGKKEIMVKPETAKKAIKGASDALNKAFDASYDKKGVAEGSLTEFAPSQPGGDDDGDDGFDEETLRRMAAHWLEGDEDPRIEQLLAAAGWEIGQDEGYDDEPGVFVVMSGDEHGKSYISWPAAELRSAMSEGMSRAAKGYEKYGREGMAALAKAGREGRALDPVRAKYDRYDEGAESENLAIGEKMARDGIEYDPAREGEIISMIGDYLRRDGMTARQVRGYMIDPDFISDQLSYLPRKSGVDEEQTVPPALNVEEAAPQLQPLQKVWAKNSRGHWIEYEVSRVRPDGRVAVLGPGGIDIFPAELLVTQQPAGAVAESRDPIEQLRADIRRFAL